MLLVLLLCAYVTAAVRDLHHIGSQKHYVYQLPPENVQSLSPSAEASHHFPAVAKMDPPNLDFPIKTVKKITDVNGNVKVVTSYTNPDQNSGINKNKQPEVKTKHVEVQQKNAPKKNEKSKTQTIKFPDKSGGIVNHEHHASVKNGKSSSYMTETSYDKSKNNQPKKLFIPVSEPLQEAARTNTKPFLASAPQKKGKNVTSKADKSKNKDINVPSSSMKKSVKKLPEKRPIETQGAGSSFISDIEEIGSDEDGYDVGYDGPHIGVGPIGHVLGGPGPPPPEGGGYRKEAEGAYSHGDKFAKGNKGGKGHKSKESFHKGQEEKHGKEHKKEKHKAEAGHKSGHLDEGKHYEKGHAEHKGADGIEKHASKGHKKGHKTSGFRTVHHKDEYKKDEVFYDEEHDTGHEKKHGQEEGIHEQSKGGMIKKGHLDSGYKDAAKGFHAAKEGGHTFDKAQGASGHQGHKSTESHKEGFDKEEGHKAQRERFAEGQKVWK